MVDVVDVRIDFISELSQRNCEHIINQILENLSPITIIKCTKVNQEWNLILRSCNVFPHDLNRTFELYYQLNPFPIKSVMGDHLSTYSIESNRLYAGGDVVRKTLTFQKDCYSKWVPIFRKQFWLRISHFFLVWHLA